MMIRSLHLNRASLIARRSHSRFAPNAAPNKLHKNAAHLDVRPRYAHVIAQQQQHYFNGHRERHLAGINSSSFVPSRCLSSSYTERARKSKENMESMTDDTKMAREEITRMVLDAKAGTLDENLIRDAEKALELWAWEHSSAGFENCLKIFNRLAEEQKTLRQHDAAAYTYKVRPFYVNRVVDCWRTCWRDKLLEIAPAEILEMIENYETYGLMTDNRTYTLIVEGMILRGDPMEAPLMAQWLLDRRFGAFEAETQDRPHSLPDTRFINTVINAWARSGRLEAPEMAEALLHQMQEMNAQGHLEAAPNVLSYGAVMKAWSLSTHRDNYIHIEGILETMKSGQDSVFPDRVCFMYALNAWADSKQQQGPDKAYAILQEMVQLFSAGNELVKPNTSNFSKVLFAQASAGDHGRVEELFQQLEDLYDTTGDPDFALNDACWRAKSMAASKSGMPEESQAILYYLVDNALAPNNTAEMPKRSFFVDIIVAWTKQKKPAQAEEVLLRMLDLASKGHSQLHPNSKCLQTILQCWAAKGNDPDAAQKAEQLLHKMETSYGYPTKWPGITTSRAYDACFAAWSRSKKHHAPERAQSLMDHLEKRHAASNENSMKPSRAAYTTVMVTWQRSRHPKRIERIEAIFNTMNKKYLAGDDEYCPDLFIYTVLASAYAEVGDTMKVKKLIDGMWQEWSNTGGKSNSPDTKLYNSLLLSLAKSKKRNATGMAEDVLREMKDKSMKLNRYSLNIMITIYATSDEPNGPEHAEKYLQQLKENNEMLTTLSYQYIIGAWTKSSHAHAVDRSEAIFNDMLYGVRSTSVPLPDFHGYRKLLQVISRSKIPRRNEQATAILSRLQRGRVPPNLLPDL